MKKEEAARRRLLSQQLSRPRFGTPEEVVDWMGMVQAQDYRHFRWAIAMRTVTPDTEALKAAFAAGGVIRVHLFRCTIQAVTPHDYTWMSSLCRERNRQIIKAWARGTGAVFPETFFAEGMEALKELLAGSRSLTKSELAEGLTRLGLPAEKARLTQLLLRAETEGLVCSGPLADPYPTWALTAERIKTVWSPLSESDALTLLARKYFRSHSPASLEDFRWWTGLPVRPLRQAIETLATELEEVKVEKETMYLWKDGTVSAPPRGHCCLLPPYDEYLIGYKSRWVSLASEHESSAHDHRGIFHPVVLYNGQVAGNWTATAPDYRPITSLFGAGRAITEKRLNAAAEAWRSARATGRP